MFTRKGGSGTPPYRSLNLSYDVGDDPGAVSQNRILIKQILQINHLAFARQIHSDQVAVVRGKTSNTLHYQGYDALITNEPGIGLLIQQADCQAVLLYDPQNQVIGAIHCGWRGSVLNIIATTIERMQREFGVEPNRLLASISPSLGSCCAEFIHYQRELPPPLHGYQVSPNHFNFWNISRDQLIAAGVERENISSSAICTCCDISFFSYRRSKKQGQVQTGRHGSVIALPQQ